MSEANDFDAVVMCPFCESYDWDIKVRYPGGSKVVQCNICLATGPQKETAKDAERAWRRRKT